MDPLKYIVEINQGLLLYVMNWWQLFENSHSKNIYLVIIVPNKWLAEVNISYLE